MGNVVKPVMRVVSRTAVAVQGKVCRVAGGGLAMGHHRGAEQGDLEDMPTVGCLVICLAHSCPENVCQLIENGGFVQSR